MSKVVLVTGSAKGIGAAIIEELAAAGYDCVINYHTSEKEAFALQEKTPKVKKKIQKNNNIAIHPQEAKMHLKISH